MPLKIYCLNLCPPVRATLLTAKTMGLDLELKVVDLLKREQIDPYFLQINPMHTLPTLDDDGFIIFDSHAICGYLVSKYGKTDALYPREAKARATVDQRLHFDSGILFPRLRAVLEPILMKNEKTIPEEKKEAVREAYDLLDKLLGDNQWVAGNQISIADFCCVATVSSLQFMVSGLERYPRVMAWVDRCKTLIPGYQETVQEGADQGRSYNGSNGSMEPGPGAKVGPGLAHFCMHFCILNYYWPIVTRAVKLDTKIIIKHFAERKARKKIFF